LNHDCSDNFINHILYDVSLGFKNTQQQIAKMTPTLCYASNTRNTFCRTRYLSHCHAI